MINLRDKGISLDFWISSLLGISTTAFDINFSLGNDSIDIRCISNYIYIYINNTQIWSGNVYPFVISGWYWISLRINNRDITCKAYSEANNLYIVGTYVNSSRWSFNSPSNSNIIMTVKNSGFVQNNIDELYITDGSREISSSAPTEPYSI